MEKRIPDGRIRHMHGVAEYMYKNAERYGQNPEEMYFLGLNHDIGYVEGNSGHEIFGAKLLLNMGVSKDKCDIIENHGITPEKYMAIHNCSEREIPLALILLWEADLHVDLTGEDVGFEARLNDIGSRWGYESEPYLNCVKMVKWIKDYNNK